ncbi:DUF805 domain-containing protein [Lacticaseibacillus daqingensis]|uniref:DUF805 domain-containing protein n=1 Tax=Lacticaseibacillus daqingensis TaxID=2486014 RepID=UPI0013DE0620|nr:DUF805 domain-containing protein [Lacticaseibacillus daqingensis]
MKRASESIAAQTHNKYYGVGGFTAVKAFFANYVNFTGRTTRREYWWVALFATLFGLIAGLGSSIYMVHQVFSHIEQFKTGMDSGNFWSIVGSMLGLIIFWLLVYLVLLLPSLAQSVRRFRDAGVHWGFFVALALVNVVWSVVFFNDNRMTAIVAVPVAIVMLVIEVMPSKNPPVEEAV